MQLIIILLAIVSILTLLSGAVVFFGAPKGSRLRSIWFFLAAILAAVWMASISCFLIADSSWNGVIEWHVKWTFVSIIFHDIAFLAYVSWREKYGRVFTLLFTIFGTIISALILIKPGLLFTDIVLSSSGNSIVMNVGPLFFSYVLFFGAIVPTILAYFIREILTTRSERKKNGYKVIAVSFAISGGLNLLFNLILPFTGNWSLVWVGPLAFSITIILFYYTILRYHSLNLSSVWLRIFSYAVIIASIAVVYMAVFAAIFAALFKGSTPSIEVIILNFIMILFFLCLMPTINHLLEYTRSLIDKQSHHSSNKKTDKK